MYKLKKKNLSVLKIVNFGYLQFNIKMLETIQSLKIIIIWFLRFN